MTAKSKKLILIFFLTIGLIYSVSGATLFNEGFEDGSYSDGSPVNWVDSACSNSPVVSSNSFIDGTNELDLNGCGGGGPFTGATGQALTNPVIRYKFRINSFTSDIDTYFSAWDATTSGGDSRSVIIRENGGNLNVLGSSTTDTLISGLNTGTIYNVELRNFDFSAETYDIYVNGNLEASGKEFWQSANDIESISPVGAGTSTFVDSVEVCDAGACSTSNSRPTVSTLEPSDGSVGVSTSPKLNITVSDSDGDSLNASFYNADTGNQIGNTQTGITSGSQISVTWTGLNEYQIYNWYVNVTDGSSTTQSSTFSFETEGSSFATYLIDNFEDNDTANWTEPGTATINAISSPVLTGMYSGESSNSGDASNVESPQVSSNTRNLSFQIRYDSSSTSPINVNPKSGSTIIGNFRCDIGGSGDFKWYDGSWVLVQSNCQTDTLYNVKIDGDFSTNTVDIYVNNSLELQGASFRNTASSWDSIDINFGSGATAQVDELKFTQSGQVSDLSINFQAPTTSAGKYPKLSSIKGNVSASTSNTLERIDLKLYNVSGLQSNISSNTSPNYNEFTGLDSGTYYLNATAVSNETSVSTGTREIVLTDSISRPNPTQLANITVSKQARGAEWGPNSQLFAIANKNGQNSQPEGIIYKRGQYGSPYKSINLDGDMLLDTAWSSDRDLVAFATAHSSNGDLQIYNISDSSNWVLVKQFSTDGKIHSVDWHPNQAKLIGESLDESVTPDSSDLTVWDISGNDETAWSEVRQTGRYGTDMFNMDVCNNKLSFSVQDLSTSPTTYETYVWDISDSNSANWGGITGSPIDNIQEGYFDPNCNFISGTQGDDNTVNKFYELDGLTEYKSINDTKDSHYRFSPNVTSDSDNILGGVAGFNNIDNIGYYNWSDETTSTFNHPLSSSSTWSSQNDWSPDGERWTTVQTSEDTLFVWKVAEDTKAPSINIGSPLNQTYSSSSVDLNVNSDESISTWEYSLDGASNQSFTPNTTLAGLSEGSHNLDVYATDSSGNTGSSSVTFTVDYIEPNISLTNPDDGEIFAYGQYENKVNINFDWEIEGGSENGNTSLYINGNNAFDDSFNSFSTGQFSYSESLSAGTYNYYVTAETEKYSIQSETRSFTVEQRDETRPKPSLNSPVEDAGFEFGPLESQYEVEFSFDVDAGSENGTAKLFLDGSQVFTEGFASGSRQTFTYKQNLSAGTYDWFIEADTPLYNTETVTRSFTVQQRDMEKPLFDLNHPAANQSINTKNQANYTLEFNGSVTAETPGTVQIQVKQPNQSTFNQVYSFQVNASNKTDFSTNQKFTDIQFVNNKPSYNVTDDYEWRLAFNSSAVDAEFNSTVQVFKFQDQKADLTEEAVVGLLEGIGNYWEEFIDNSNAVGKAFVGFMLVVVFGGIGYSLAGSTGGAITMVTTYLVATISGLFPGWLLLAIIISGLAYIFMFREGGAN